MHDESRKDPIGKVAYGATETTYAGAANADSGSSPIRHSLGSPSQQYMGNMAEAAHNHQAIGQNAARSANEIRMMLAGNPTLRLIGDALVEGTLDIPALDEFIQRWRYVTSPSTLGR